MTLQEMREAADLTVPQLLEGCPIKGIDQSLVSKIEHGLADPTESFMRYVAARCGQEYAPEETPDLQVKPDALIPLETRREAYQAMDRVGRRNEILAVWEGVMTGWDVLASLPYTQTNAVLPRITEMNDAGLLEVVGKRKSLVTDRWVTAYRLTEKGQAMKWRLMHGTDSTEGQAPA